jgi:hypothetical protein
MREVLYSKNAFIIHGRDLSAANRFFTSMSPKTVKVLRACRLYWSSTVPLFVRELTYENRMIQVDISYLVLKESILESISSTLTAVSPTAWADLHVQGHRSIFQFDISAHPGDISQMLRDYARAKPWPCHYFASPMELTWYRMDIRWLKDGRYTTKFPYVLSPNRSHGKNDRNLVKCPTPTPTPSSSPTRGMGARGRFEARRSRRLVLSELEYYDIEY